LPVAVQLANKPFERPGMDTCSGAHRASAGRSAPIR